MTVFLVWCLSDMHLADNHCWNWSKRFPPAQSAAYFFRL